MGLPSFEDTVPDDTPQAPSLPAYEDTVPDAPAPVKKKLKVVKGPSVKEDPATPATPATPAAPALRMTIAPDQGSLGSAAVGVDKTDITDPQAENNARLQGYLLTELPKSKKSDAEEADFLANHFYPTDDSAKRLLHRRELTKAVKYYRGGGTGPIPFYKNESDLPEPITVVADKNAVAQNRADQAAEAVPGPAGITAQVNHGILDAGRGVLEESDKAVGGAARLVDKLAKKLGTVKDDNTDVDEAWHQIAQGDEAGYYNDDGYARTAGNFVGAALPYVATDGLAVGSRLLGEGALAKGIDVAAQSIPINEVASGGDISPEELIAQAGIIGLLGGAGDAAIGHVKGEPAVPRAVSEYGPDGERVQVSPQIEQDWYGRNYREYKATAPDGSTVHQGWVYEDGPILSGNGKGDVHTLSGEAGDHIRAVARQSETLDNLAPGEPVDPTKSDGSFAGRPEDPELAKQFDEEIPNEEAPQPEQPAEPDVVTRFREVLRTAGEARADQETLFREERARRFEEAKKAQQPGSGEQAYIGSLSAMKGQLPKADYENISHHFNQKDVDDLFDVITKTKTLTTDGKLSAYAGLRDALNGKIPGQSNLIHLQEAYGGDFVKDLLKKRTRAQKMVSEFAQAWNLPKELMATADLSAPLRQGIGLIHRQEWRDAFKAMFGHAWSEENYTRFRNEMKQHPNYERAEQGGLAITTTDGLGPSEDVFVSHLGIKIADKTPVIGGVAKGVLEGSERAYVGFLNKLRFDTFNTMLEQARKLGHDIDDEKVLKGISNYINVMTGRGGLGEAERASKLLTSIFFSPRLISSRMQILTAPLLAPFGKGFIADLPKGMRKEAVKSYVGMMSTYTTALSLAVAAGYTVELNPLSSDFGKIKDGNTRVDLGGGLLQFITAGARALMRESKSTSSGSTRELDKKGDTPLDNDIKFILNKLHPSLSLIVDQQRGTDSVGNKFTWSKALLSRLTPLGIPDIVATLKEHPDANGALYSVLGVIGGGLQTYPPKGGGTDLGLPKIEETFPDAAPTAADERVNPESPKPKLPSFNETTHVEDTTEGNLNAVKVLKGMGLHPSDEGVRSLEEQEYLYKNFKGVAKPGTSRHGDGLAVDISIPKGITPKEIKTRMEAHGYKNVSLITKRHGKGPHWHVQWDSWEED